MKYIAVNDLIVDFSGGIIPGEKGEPVRVRDILLQYLGAFLSEKGKDLVIARKVGQAVYDCKIDKLALEDAEFEILEKSIAKPRHGALLMAPLFAAVEDAKKEIPAKNEGKTGE